MLSRCSEHNSSILISAVKNDDRVLLTYLLDAVEPSNLLENLEAETSSGDTALTLAARCGRYRTLRSLLEYISHRNCSLAVVNNETTRGATALIEATREGRCSCVDLLLRHAHSDPNRLSKVHAKSAIDWAADFDRDNILVELEKQSKVIKDFKLLCSVIARADVDTLREMIGAGEPQVRGPLQVAPGRNVADDLHGYVYRSIYYIHISFSFVISSHPPTLLSCPIPIHSSSERRSLRGYVLRGFVFFVGTADEAHVAAFLLLVLSVPKKEDDSSSARKLRNDSTNDR